jgi:hypothetical protein
MEKLDPFNGYEYVDLGLPSGTLWAKMNVGANSETDYGLYFAWGETTGYPDGKSGKYFNWYTYKWGNPTASDLTKYNNTDGKTVLDLEDDAAAVNMGGEWHMPTQAQIEELLDNTTNAWVTDYNGSGVDGRLFTSKTDASKKLFLPASGYYSSNNLITTPEICSNSRQSNKDPQWFCALFYNSNGIGLTCNNERCQGTLVRGVIG